MDWNEKEQIYVDKLNEQMREIERLRIGHQRYETARCMNPRQWADAWKLNTTTGKPFDEIIDDMRPFMVPNLMCTPNGASTKLYTKD